VATIRRSGWLAEILSEIGIDKMVQAEVNDILEPFYSIAKSGEPYPFKLADELDEAEIAQAIQRALVLGDLSPQIILVSISQLEKPDWMTDSMWRTSIRNNLGRGLVEEIEIDYRGRFGSILGDDLRADLWTNLWNKLGSGLRTSLKLSLGDDFGDSPEDYLCPILFCHLESVIANDQKIFKSLKPFVRILTGCIPVVEKRDQKNTFPVLCS
jgi:hypothetical protein